MATIRQESAIEKLVENGGNVTQAMREAGYSEATANNPSNLTQSKGFKELLKASGLDEGLVVAALVEDIKLKPQNRVRELSLASEILGLRRKGVELGILESNAAEQAFNSVAVRGNTIRFVDFSRSEE